MQDLDWDSHWSKPFVFCPVIGQRAGKIMIAAFVAIVYDCNLYFYFLCPKNTSYFCKCYFCKRQIKRQIEGAIKDMIFFKVFT